MMPYERLLGDAMRGDATLFARQDERRGGVARGGPDPRQRRPAVRVRAGTWGPREADALIASYGRWRPVLSTSDGAENHPAESHPEEAAAVH